MYIDSLSPYTKSSLTKYVPSTYPKIGRLEDDSERLGKVRDGLVQELERTMNLYILAKKF